MIDPSRLRRFLAPAECRVGETVALAPEQSRHMVTVLRIGAGRHVRLFTGSGSEFIAEVVRADASAALVRVLEELQPPARTPRPITLAFAPAPGNRSDIVIEKATELGVGRLVPLLCERVQAGQARAAEGRADRWRRKAAEAARQSRRAVVPQLSPPSPWSASCRPSRPGCALLPPGRSILPSTESSPPRP